MDRSRISIPFLGINTADSDYTVKDGYCDKMHNLSYCNGSFEVAREQEIDGTVDVIDNGWTVMHKMDDCPDLIAIKVLNGILEVSTVSSDGGVLNSTGRLHVALGNTPIGGVTFFSFGKVLYITLSKPVVQEYVYVYKDATFVQFDVDSLPPPAMSISADIKEVLPDTGSWSGWRDAQSLDWFMIGDTDKYANTDFLPILKIDYDSHEVDTRSWLWGKHVAKANKDGYIVGAVAIFVAYKLFDGSIIKPSRPVFLNTQILGGRNHLNKGLTDILYDSRNGMNGMNSASYYSKFWGAKFKISITIPDIVKENDLIDSITVFSTRDIPVFDFGKIESLCDAADETLYATRRGPLPTDRVKIRSMPCFSLINRDEYDLNTPFYEIVDISKDFESQEITWTDHYQNIEHQAIFKPNYAIHTQTSLGKYEYNSMLHSYNTLTRLFNGYNAFAMSEYIGVFGDYKQLYLDEPAGGTLSLINPDRDQQGDVSVDAAQLMRLFDDHEISISLAIKLLIDGETKTVQLYQTGHFFKYENKDGDTRRLLLYNLQVYPDARAKELIISVIYTNYSGQRCKYIKSVKLKSCPANNLATGWIDDTCVDNDSPQDVVHILLSKISASDDENEPIILDDRYFDSNIIRVSSPNNPFVNNLKNTYRIGAISDRITGLGVTSDQLTEGRIGQHPLLVFTQTGIYALEQGQSGDLLYANVIALSADLKISGSNTIGVDGQLYYLGPRGLYSIRGRQVIYMSAVLERRAGYRQDTTIDFAGYCQSAKLYYDYTMDELMICNYRYGYAYIYSPAANVWTTRDWVGMSINNSRCVYIPSRGLHNIGQYGEKPLRDVHIITRALKLGNFEYKRLEAVVARLVVDNATHLATSIMASDDLDKWVTAHKGSTATLRRMLASYRYYRYTISAVVNRTFAVSHFDVSYYIRFFNKLR